MTATGPLKITLAYTIAGSLWILASDWLLHRLVADPTVLEPFAMLKGGIFISVTGVILYRIVRKDYVEQARILEKVNGREEYLRKVLETLPVGVWLIDGEGRIVYGNAAGQDIWCGKRLVGADSYADYKGWWLATGKPVEADEWGAARALRKGEASLDEEIEIECFDGRRKMILHSAVPVQGSSGEVLGAVVVNQDITAQKLMADKLRENEKSYQLLFNDNPQPMFVYDRETLAFLAVNHAAVSQYGYRSEEFLEMTIEDIRPPETVPQLRQSVEGMKVPLRRVGVWQHLRKDGTVLDAEIVTHDIVFNGRQGRLVLARDVTEERKAQREIHAYQEQLRLLASEISLIEERERHQIATTLHDQIGQTLALARIKLGALGTADGLGCRKKDVEEIRVLIEEAIRSSRSLTFDLSPPILYAFGLEPALQSLCEKYQEEHGIAIEFDSDKSAKPMNDDIRVLLFQAVRELLVNVIKHAEARSVQVRSLRVGSSISIEVEDDGKGLLPGIGPDTCRGFGLFSIRERLEYVGGSFSAESAPGRGTRVVLAAPLTAGQNMEESIDTDSSR